jgi:tetratricopeptide (TPR) repeat protein
VKFRAAAAQLTPSYSELLLLYDRALSIDPNNVETNFNVGLLHLPSDLDASLEGFKKSVACLDMLSTYRAQFAKAYCNIGMIYDKKGDVSEAARYYEQAKNVCEEDPSK